MKNTYILIFTFFFSFSVFSQINLSVHLKRSNSENDITFIVDTLKIFKDEILFRKIPFPDSFALYENVGNGNYKFCYNNLFGEKIENNISLNNTNNILGGQDIELYVDELQNPKSNELFMIKLQNGDELKISLKFSGCFNSGSELLTISKNKNHFFVTYKNKKRKLKANSFDVLVKYETELRNLPKVNFVSTSNGFNEISLNGENFSYSEPSFFWNGYETLKKELNLK